MPDTPTPKLAAARAALSRLFESRVKADSETRPLHDDISAALDRLAEVEKDRERLDWLQEQKPWPLGSKLMHSIIVDPGESVRAAIDAALAQREDEGGE